MQGVANIGWVKKEPRGDYSKSIQEWLSTKARQQGLSVEHKPEKKSMIKIKQCKR